jgi:hypothetical protein
MFWYISKNKIDLLSEMHTAPSPLPSSLAVRLKVPWVEAETKWDKSETSSIATIPKLADAINKRYNVRPYSQLDTGEAPTMILFKGTATRVIQKSKFWVAMHDGCYGLLMAGSSSNVLGGLSAASDAISPSVNPIEAIENAFRGNNDESTLPRVLSFAWQSIWRSQGNAAVLPTVWGLAVFAGRFPTVKAEVRRAGRSELTEMIVVSPIFIQQIETATPHPSQSP